MPRPSAAVVPGRLSARKPGMGVPTPLATGRSLRGSGLQRSYFILAGHCPGTLPVWVTEVGESWWPVNETCSRACSPIMAIELVEQGALALEQDARVVDVGAGDAFVLKLGSRHRYRAISGFVRKSYIGLAGPLAEEITARLPDCITLRDAARIRDLFADLRRLFKRMRGDWQAQASAIAYQVLVELLLSSRSERGETILPPAIERVLPLIERRDGQAHSMTDLARVAGVSAAHLHRLFRAHLQTTPQRYGLLHAMRQAQAQLLNTDQACNAIAAGLGFTPLYFSAVFRRVVGMPPSEFRRRNR